MTRKNKNEEKKPNNFKPNTTDVNTILCAEDQRPS